MAVVGAIGRGLACWLLARVILSVLPIRLLWDGLRELRCRSCSAATLRPGTGSTAPGLLRCRSSRSLPPSLKRMRASCPFCFYRHRASVRCADSPPSMAPRRLRSQRPVSARSLWCGLRSSFLVAPPSRRSVATTRLHATSLPSTDGNVFWSFFHPSPFQLQTSLPASCRVAPGGVLPPGWLIGGPSGPACLRRVRSNPRVAGIVPEDCDDILSSLSLWLRCAQRLRDRCTRSASSRRTNGHPTRQKESPPRGGLMKASFHSGSLGRFSETTPVPFDRSIG